MNIRLILPIALVVCASAALVLWPSSEQGGREKSTAVSSPLQETSVTKGRDEGLTDDNVESRAEGMLTSTKETERKQLSSKERQPDSSSPKRGFPQDVWSISGPLLQGDWALDWDPREIVTELENRGFRFTPDEDVHPGSMVSRRTLGAHLGVEAVSVQYRHDESGTPGLFALRFVVPIGQLSQEEVQQQVTSRFGPGWQLHRELEDNWIYRNERGMDLWVSWKENGETAPYGMSDRTDVVVVAFEPSHR